MLNTAIVGLGWWGKTLVEAAEASDAIRFVAGAGRTLSPELETFARLAPKDGKATEAKSLAAELRKMPGGT